MTVEEILARGIDKRLHPFAESNFVEQSRETNHAIFCAKAALKALTDAGYAVVPVEPTEAMLDVFHDQIRIEALPHKKQCRILNDKHIYKAMIETGAHKV